MIDEKKLIEEIINTPTEESGYNPVYLNGCATRQHEILDIIDRQPKVGQWIPCSERLPEEPVKDRDGYIVQAFANNEPFTAYWYGDGWEDDNGMEVYGIIAWQPLPEPYKESEEQHGTL